MNHKLVIFTIIIIFNSTLGKEKVFSSSCTNFNTLTDGADVVFSLISEFLSPVLEYQKYFFGDHIDWDELESYDIIESEWKKSLVNESKKIHDEVLDYLETEAKPPVKEYNHTSIFRAPDNVNDLWLTEISLASDKASHIVDKLNILANGGMFSSEIYYFTQYEKYEKQLHLLGEMSMWIHLGFENYAKYSKMIQSKEMHINLQEYIDTNLEKDATCLYDYMSGTNLTIFNTFTEVVTKDDFVNYVKNLSSEALKIVNTTNPDMILNTIISAFNVTTQKTDINLLFMKTYLVFFQMRSLVLGIDLRQFFVDLDNVHQSIGEGYNRLVEGQWPEMKNFISKFLRKTLISEKFWWKVNELYHNYVKIARGMYRQREKSLEQWIRNDLVTFLNSVSEQMIELRTTNNSLVDDLMSLAETTDINSILEPPLDKIISIISRHYLSCFTAFYGKPDFQQLESFVASNYITKFLKELVEADWPEEGKVPKGLPDFVENLQTAVMLIVTSFLGSCSDPNYV